jgi:RimJ/RimL family protein N-acetyltransferase
VHDEVLTSRLRLRRPVADEDSELYRDLFLHPAIQQWLRPAPLEPLDEAGADDILSSDAAHWAREGYGPWVVLLRAQYAFAGRAGLRQTVVADEPAVEITWAILPPYQRAGLATEAAHAAVDVARDLGLTELVAITLADNVASRRVMEGTAFQLDRRVEHVGLPHVLYRRAP